MLLDLLHSIFLVRYTRGHPSRFGAALDLMMVSMMVSVTTGDKKPLTASGLARRLRMPRSTVDRRLLELRNDRAVKLVNNRYVADLDLLDRFVMSKAHVDRDIKTIETCLRELKRLRALLHDQLRD